MVEQNGKTDLVFRGGARVYGGLTHCSPTGSAGQVGAEGWDFSRGAETVPIHSVDRYFTGTFVEGKSLTHHLPRVNNFWKDIWLNHIGSLASQIERNFHLSFFSGLFMPLVFFVN